MKVTSESNPYKQQADIELDLSESASISFRGFAHKKVIVWADHEGDLKIAIGPLKLSLGRDGIPKVITDQHPDISNSDM